MKLKMTLEEFRDLINKSDGWYLYFRDIISKNKWNDECHEVFGICNDGKLRLQFNSEMIAEIVEL